MIPENVTVEREELIVPIEEETASLARYTPVNYEEPLPVLLMSIPYRKDDYITYGGHDPTIRYLAKHGYEVVVHDILGTGGSSGYKPKWTAFSGDEAEQVINWLADQDWSTGRVGMFGQSYGGRTVLNAAAAQPEPLEAIIPITTAHRSYDYAKRPGGTLAPRQLAWATRMQTFAATPPTVKDDKGRWSKIWKKRLELLTEGEPWLFGLIENKNKDTYWTEYDVDPSKIEAATFTVTGWRDYYPNASLEFTDQIDAPKRLLIGPWRHTRPHQGVEIAINFREQMIEWFDHFLKDEKTDALDHEYIEYWTEYNEEGSIKGIWRSSESWPPEIPETSTDLILTKSGLQTSFESKEESIHKEYEYDHSVGINSIDYVSPPTDTSADDARSICFETKLDNPILLSGRGEATINIEPTTEDLLIAVRVIDVDPTNSASLVTYGRTLASNRNTYKKSDYLTPDESHQINISLKPVSYIFNPNHKIRIAISTSYFPYNLNPVNHGSMTLHSSPDDPSTISLPAEPVNDINKLESKKMKSPDDEVVPTHSDYLIRSDREYLTARENNRDIAQFKTIEDKSIRLPHRNGAIMDYRSEFNAQIKSHDPTERTIISKVDISVDHGLETWKVLGESRVSPQNAQLKVSAELDGQNFYRNKWTK